MKLKADIVAATWASLKLKNKVEDTEQALGDCKEVQFARVHSFHERQKEIHQSRVRRCLDGPDRYRLPMAQAMHRSHLLVGNEFHQCNLIPFSSMFNWRIHIW